MGLLTDCDNLMDSIDIVLFLEGHAHPPLYPNHGTLWLEYHSRLGIFVAFEFDKEDGWHRLNINDGQ